VTQPGLRAYRLVRPSTPEPPPLALDPRQEAVVAHRRDPLLVRGAPGTGKTALLVEAVAARIAEGSPPESVLALTYGRRAAHALRHRIEGRIGRGDRATGEPLVRTFHGYAFGLLRRAAAENGEPAPRLLTGAEQDLIIRELLADDPHRFGFTDDFNAAFATRAFAAELRDLLLRCVERGLGPSDLDRLGVAHDRPDWRAAARFFREYREVLALRDATSRGTIAYDYAEIVRAASALLREEPDLLEQERRRLHHIYVDEFADTDPTQVELLQLVGDRQHLVVFADPDSSTFAFRGADPTTVGRFSELFRRADNGPSAEIILDRNYRSGEALLTAARRVSARLGGPGSHRQTVPPPRDRADGLVEIHTLRSTAAEAAFVANRLRQAHLRDAVPWSRMAVIVRSMALQLPILRRALNQAGVPTHTAAEELPLMSQPAVAPLLLLLRCALRPGELTEQTAIDLLHSPLGGADPLSERFLRQGLRTIALAAQDRRPSGVLLVEALLDPTDLAVIERRWATPAKRIAGLLQTAKATAAGPSATAEDVLWAVWQASGLAVKWAAESRRGGARGEVADRDLDAIVALFDAAARFVDRLPGARAEVFLEHILGQQLPADTIAPSADRGSAVQLVTAHGAKGLEWDVVVVAGVQEGIWPNLRLRGTVLGSELLVDVLAGRAEQRAAVSASQAAAILQEERRLFYVAATRARRRLVVTAVARGEGAEQPSRFLDELGAPADAPAEAAPTAQPAATLGRLFTLPGLVAELRIAVGERTNPIGVRVEAANQLARLAAAGVPGADPDQWWGLRSLSDSNPLVPPGQPVRVSPSTLDSVRKCGLRWLLERHGGGTPPDASRNLGNLVHDAAMRAADAPDQAALIAYVVSQFDKIEIPARWMTVRERNRAERMIGRLVAWLRDNPRRLAAVEEQFSVILASAAVEVGEAEDGGHPVELTGRVDRLEIDDQGRLYVIDLKTGKGAPSQAEVAEHPQLGAYQVAVELGAFPQFGTDAGGAALVQLGNETKTPKVQEQPPLADTPNPHWARSMVRKAARQMADSTFQAVVNDSCRRCPVRSSCPVSGKGRQVTPE
jgi:superfamily I DNA/RNA helicase/RecB family exonuclease